MATAPALSIRDLKKTYVTQKGKRTVEALKGVSLEINEGEFFSLLGPNGAGKSTLIGIVAGLTVKSGGAVRVRGVSIDEDPSLAKSYIGLVPQEQNFDIFEKVENIILDQAGYYGIPRAEAAPRAEVLLKELGLWEKRHDQSQALSGGMKRRLMIARALIHEPKVLLLDEPTAGVDVELRRGMWDFLQKLNSGGTTIILTTHYLEEAEQLANRVAVINKGSIVEEGSVKQLLSKLNYVSLLLDLASPVDDATLTRVEGVTLERVDEDTVKITLAPGEGVNAAFAALTKAGIEVASVRNPGGRLEEAFMHIINEPAS